MKVKELIEELKEFQKSVDEHYYTWERAINNSIDGIDYDTFVEMNPVLVGQARILSARFDKLKHYIFLFRDKWLFSAPSNPMYLYLWILDEVFKLKSIPKIKKLCVEKFIEGIEEIIDKLETFPRDCDISPILNRTINAETGVDFLMLCNLEFLHPFINKGCSKLFLDGHYSQAVEASVKAVMQYIKDKTLLTEDGEKLITKVFSKDQPILAFSDLSTETLHNEQVGFMMMLQGFVRGVRNVLAHTHGKQEEARKAYEYLFMASLFCRRIDETTKTKP